MTDDSTSDASMSNIFGGWRSTSFALFMALDAMVLYMGVGYFMHHRAPILAATT